MEKEKKSRARGVGITEAGFCFVLFLVTKCNPLNSVGQALVSRERELDAERADLWTTLS